MEAGVVRSQMAGTPQGGVISPLLANIYLDRLDRVWRQKGMEARSGYNARLVRYADDVVILTDKSPQEPYRLLMETLSEMGLKAHPDKTRVLNAGEGDFDFLGFNFRKTENPRTGKSFPLVRPSKKAQEALRNKLKEKTSPKVQMNIGEVVRTINPVLRGWVNYFRIGHSAKVFQVIRYFAICRVRKCMRRKQGRAGYGWKRLPGEFFYDTLGLFSDYAVTGRPRPAWAH
jgi:hypothetical protein